MDNPSLAEVIRLSIEDRLTSMHTAIPGVVVKYNPVTNTADVQPALLKKYADGIPGKYPIIPSVPVVFPRAAAGQAFMSFPILTGDYVLLVFSERSVDTWKTTGGIVDPGDPRKFNMTDAFAIPGGSPLLGAVDASATDVRVQNVAARLDMGPAGSFALKNQVTGAELVSDLIDVLSAIRDGVVVAGGFPGTWDPATKLLIQGFITKLMTLKAV